MFSFTEKKYISFPESKLLKIALLWGMSVIMTQEQNNVK